METGITVIGVDECGELEVEVNIIGEDDIEHKGRMFLSREFLECLLERIEDEVNPTSDLQSQDHSTYKPRSRADPIRFFGGNEFTKRGFYFYNKTWDELHGPFATLEKCREEERRVNGS